MAKMKMYKWTVEFEVAAEWVADGFEMTNERAMDMLSHDLRFAHGTELKATVIKKPTQKSIRKEQGYSVLKD